MADIKTRESLHTVKTFDRVQNLAAKTREGANEAKQSVSDTFASGESSENEYAGNRLEAYESGTARLAVRAGDKIGRWGVRETSRNIRKWRNRPKKLKVDVPKLKELPAPNQTPLLEAPKTAAKGGSKAVQTTAKTTTKTAKGAVKTTKSAVKTTEKTAKATAKTAKATAKATARAAKAAAKAAKAAAQATVKFVKVAAKAIVAAVKATVAAVKGIVAAIAAGGWVAVVIILVIVIIGGLIAGICAIFTPNDEGGYSVSYMMSVCENEAIISEREIIANTPHDYLEITGSEPSMKDIVAVYAVKTNSLEDNFVTADEKNQEEFRTVFYTMYLVRYYTTQRQETVKKQYTDANGNPYYVEETVTRTVLHIERRTMSASSAADHFSFNKKQREHLDTLMSQEFDEMWAVLVD